MNVNPIYELCQKHLEEHHKWTHEHCNWSAPDSNTEQAERGRDLSIGVGVLDERSVSICFDRGVDGWPESCITPVSSPEVAIAVIDSFVEIAREFKRMGDEVLELERDLGLVSRNSNPPPKAVPSQLSILELVKMLEALPPDFLAGVGGLVSYRGNYAALALEPVLNPDAERTVKGLIAELKWKTGREVQGWKGGLYRVFGGTPVFRAFAGVFRAFAGEVSGLAIVGVDARDGRVKFLTKTVK